MFRTASSSPGANAPLKNSCANSNQPTANELSAIEQWTAAGMPANKILMGVPAYGYVSSSTATTLVHKRDEIPSAPVVKMSNRERANLAHATRDVGSNLKPRSNRERATLAHASDVAARTEQYKSPFHRAYEQGHAALAERRRAARALKRSERRAASPALAIEKRQSAPIYCPENHSRTPCAGVEGQNITTIDWNPLDDVKNSTAGSGGDGVFTGNVGKNKLGQGDLSGLEGNQIDFWKLINYGVLVQDGTTFNPVNGYTRAWDECSSTVSFLFVCAPSSTQC